MGVIYRSKVFISQPASVWTSRIIIAPSGTARTTYKADDEDPYHDLSSPLPPPKSMSDRPWCFHLSTLTVQPSRSQPLLGICGSIFDTRFADLTDHRAPQPMECRPVGGSAAERKSRVLSFELNEVNSLMRDIRASRETLHLVSGRRV